jgi:AraC-like DNA-binding protein
MTALWQVDGAVDRASLRDVEQSLASALAAATATRDEGPTIGRTALRVAVMQHARDHLTDRALSVSSVSRRFAISPRTLHNAFLGSDDSFAATVRAMRLDSCAALLADPAECRTVTDIATAHGFDDPTSFSRAFRRRFHRSPRDVRRSAALTAAASPAPTDT